MSLSEKLKGKLDSVIDTVRKLRRAMEGKQPDEDIFSGLLNVKDIKERTRVNEHEVYAHSYMRLLADIGGEEWSIMNQVSDMEDHYLIALEGEQRKEAILMQRAKAEIRMGEIGPISVPQVQTKPIEEKPKGKGDKS